MMAKDQQKPISGNYAVKSDDDPKTNKTNILVYALKSDDGERPTKTNIQELCYKKRWCFKNQQTNILVYAVKGDDDKKTELLKPGKSFIRFIWCANYAKF